MIKRAKRKTNFTVVNNEIYADNVLSFEAMGLLTYLLSKPENWQINVKQLAKVTDGTDQKRGTNKIYSLLNALIGAGYIERQKLSTGEMIYNVYDEPVTAEREADSPVHSNPNQAKPVQGNPVQESSETLISNVIQQELSIKKEISPNKETSESSHSENPNISVNQKSDFEELWDIYPKQQGKQQAHFVYKTQIKNGHSHDEMMAGALEYAENCKLNGTEPRYIKSLDNWLKEERWSDRYAKPEPDWKQTVYQLMGKVDGKRGNEHCFFFAQGGESDQEWAQRVIPMIKAGMANNWDIEQQKWKSFELAKELHKKADQIRAKMFGVAV